jgi:hypothetical protein
MTKHTNKLEEELPCGSDTMFNGVCTVCGQEPYVNQKWFSRKEWDRIKHKYLTSEEKQDE